MIATGSMIGEPMPDRLTVGDLLRAWGAADIKGLSLLQPWASQRERLHRRMIPPPGGSVVLQWARDVSRGQEMARFSGQFPRRNPKKAGAARFSARGEGQFAGRVAR